MQCPRCGSDTLQKVSAIWRQQSQTSRGSGYTSSTQSLLASTLSPPSRPIRSNFLVQSLLVLLLFFYVLITVGTLRMAFGGEPPHTGVFYLIFFHIFGLVLSAGLLYGGWHGIRWRSRRWKAKQSEYSQSMDRWDRGFYCHTCEAISYLDQAPITEISET